MLCDPLIRRSGVQVIVTEAGMPMFSADIEACSAVVANSFKTNVLRLAKHQSQFNNLITPRLLS